ncbi:MAG: Holliday junction resolvase RuvX [bacterium]|nr:Holliday junction resolvase RuvX [bacterium]
MRLLGIDYGEKKIGVAISDESAKFAFPHGVIDNVSANGVLKALKIICDKNDVRKIILGQSLTYKMQPNPIMKRIEKFKSFIEERINIPVEYESEILTTKQAERTTEEPRTGARMKSRKKEEKIHASAAALILQSYLDKQR